MEMDEEFLEIHDLDWFAIYQIGRLCHFATAGRGYVPPEVTRSMEDWESANSLVEALPDVYDAIIVEEGLPRFESKRHRNGYIAMHVEMARKGLHSHDLCDGGYVLVAKPRTADEVAASLPGVKEVIPRLTVHYATGGFRVMLP
ncbi:hypothetical protein [Stenotrophomonas sp.]|uniref:hypothetical protein n=1 Tax=Stenotrophomonas sp. TaxID=69392 RepID=UPI002897929E|nr:hypothetical protein [Stenotrophomonas sp.]